MLLAAKIRNPRTMPNAFWAEPRRLHRQIRRAFIALGQPLSTAELAEWAYPETKRVRWHWQNIGRSMADFGYKPVGRIPGRSLLWAIDID